MFRKNFRLGRERPMSQMQKERESPQQVEDRIRTAVDSWMGGEANEPPDKPMSRKNVSVRNFKNSHSMFGGKDKEEEKEEEKEKPETKSEGKKVSSGRKSVRERPIFNIAIEIAARKSDPEEGLIPSPIRNGIKYINERAREEDGLYRVPGSHAKYLEYKSRFNMGEDVDFCEVEKVHQNVAMMVIKFLKDLPEPLYTDNLAPRIRKILYQVKDKDKQAKLLRKTMVMLPLVNREVFRFIIHHFRYLGKYRSEEQMNASVLSWGISLGRMMGRLLEVLLEGDDNLIPQTRVFGVDYQEACQRSHKKGLIAVPIRYAVNSLMANQAESPNFLDKMIEGTDPETLFTLKFQIDGVTKSNVLSGQSSSVVSAVLKSYLSLIPGTILSPEFLDEFNSLVGEKEDAVNKLKALIEKMPPCYQESLKLLVWYFAHLGWDERFQKDKIPRAIDFVFGDIAPVISLMLEHFATLWPETQGEVQGQEEQKDEQEQEQKNEVDPSSEDVSEVKCEECQDDTPRSLLSQGDNSLRSQDE